MVLSGALLRDLLSKNELSRMLSMITLVFMIAPLLAPIIGGNLMRFFHWHAIFYVISAMGMLSAVIGFCVIPETHKKENRIPLRLNIIARNFFFSVETEGSTGLYVYVCFWFWRVICFCDSRFNRLYRTLWYSR